MAECKLNEMCSFVYISKYGAYVTWMWLNLGENFKIRKKSMRRQGKWDGIYSGKWKSVYWCNLWNTALAFIPDSHSIQTMSHWSFDVVLKDVSCLCLDYIWPAWLNNCVGHFNHRYFFLFCLYMWLGTVYVSICAYPLFKVHFYGETAEVSQGPFVGTLHLNEAYRICCASWWPRREQDWPDLHCDWCCPLQPFISVLTSLLIPSIAVHVYDYESLDAPVRYSWSDINPEAQPVIVIQFDNAPRKPDVSLLLPQHIGWKGVFYLYYLVKMAYHGFEARFSSSKHALRCKHSPTSICFSGFLSSFFFFIIWAMLWAFSF